MSAKIIFLTLVSENEFLKACLEAGVMGYVRKLSIHRHWVPAIQGVRAGQFYVSKSGIPQ
jgi:DNA-binding NarL/FixJ family response regulator